MHDLHFNERNIARIGNVKLFDSGNIPITVKWLVWIIILFGCNALKAQTPPTNGVHHASCTNCDWFPVTNVFLAWSNHTSNCWAHLLEAQTVAETNNIHFSQWYEIDYTNLAATNYLVEVKIDQPQAFFRVVLEQTNN